MAGEGAVARSATRAFRGGRLWRSPNFSEQEIGWFFDTRRPAQTYGRVRDYDITLGRALEVDAQGQHAMRIPLAGLPEDVRAQIDPRRVVDQTAWTDAVAKAAQLAGYDSVAFRNVGGITRGTGSDTIYATLSRDGVEAARGLGLMPKITAGSAAAGGLAALAAPDEAEARGAPLRIAARASEDLAATMLPPLAAATPFLLSPQQQEPEPQDGFAYLPPASPEDAERYYREPLLMEEDAASPFDVRDYPPSGYSQRRRGETPDDLMFPPEDMGPPPLSRFDMPPLMPDDFGADRRRDPRMLPTTRAGMEQALAMGRFNPLSYLTAAAAEDLIEHPLSTAAYYSGAGALGQYIGTGARRDYPEFRTVFDDPEKYAFAMPIEEADSPEGMLTNAAMGPLSFLPFVGPAAKTVERGASMMRPAMRGAVEGIANAGRAMWREAPERSVPVGQALKEMAERNPLAGLRGRVLDDPSGRAPFEGAPMGDVPTGPEPPPPVFPDFPPGIVRPDADLAAARQRAGMTKSAESLPDIPDPGAFDAEAAAAEAAAAQTRAQRAAEAFRSPTVQTAYGRPKGAALDTRRGVAGQMAVDRRTRLPEDVEGVAADVSRDLELGRPVFGGERGAQRFLGAAARTPEEEAALASAGRDRGLASLMREATDEWIGAVPPREAAPRAPITVRDQRRTGIATGASAGAHAGAAGFLLGYLGGEREPPPLSSAGDDFALAMPPETGLSEPPPPPLPESMGAQDLAGWGPEVPFPLPKVQHYEDGPGPFGEGGRLVPMEPSEMLGGRMRGGRFGADGVEFDIVVRPGRSGSGAADVAPDPAFFSDEQIRPGSSEDIMRLQEALAAAGFDPGRIDGTRGEQTRRAEAALAREYGGDAAPDDPNVSYRRALGYPTGPASLGGVQQLIRQGADIHGAPNPLAWAGSSTGVDNQLGSRTARQIAPLLGRTSEDILQNGLSQDELNFLEFGRMRGNPRYEEQLAR